MLSIRQKNKKIKNRLNIIFKIINISINHKIFFLSIILGFISLILPWIIIGDNNYSVLYAFNKITFFSNFIILVILILNFIFILSIKEKKNYELNFLILGNGVIILLSINSIFLINGLKIFYANINYGNGVVLLLISGIIGMITSFKFKNEKNSKIVISDTEEKTNYYKEKNMKLPI